MNDEKKYTVAEAHEYFAKNLNGRTWELLEKSGRTKAEDELMIYAAQASCYHWLVAGTPLHHQRAEWLISRVYAVIGKPRAALGHALRCMELTEQNPALMKDFDLAYACEALARAHALAGDKEDAKKYLEEARPLGQAIANEEDKKIFLGDLQGGDWHGIH